MRIVTQFSILNYARSSHCLFVLPVRAQELMKLFDPVCGHKEHQFTGLAFTTGNGEEFRLGGGGCTRRASLWVAAGSEGNSSSILCCLCQLQTPEQYGGSAVEGRVTPSYDQLRPVSHSYLRSITACFLTPSWSQHEA